MSSLSAMERYQQALAGRELTAMGALLQSDEYRDAQGQLLIPFGRQKDGHVFVEDMSSVPHLLIAGATGSGKTAFVKSLIAGLMLRYSPDQVQFVIYDSKALDYTAFSQSSHLAVPLARPQQGEGVLGFLLNEVHERLKQNKRLPHIFAIFDDYIGVANNRTTEVLSQLLTVARVANIHVIIVTTTPSATVLPVEVRSNLSHHIAFHTASKTFSRMILDESGGETLDFPGELIYKAFNRRIQCQTAFISPDELDLMIQLAREDFPFAPSPVPSTEPSVDHSDDSEDKFQQAVKLVREAGGATTSLLQRGLRIGYAHAGRLLEKMLEQGIIILPEKPGMPYPVLSPREEKAIEGNRHNTSGSEEPNRAVSRAIHSALDNLWQAPMPTETSNPIPLRAHEALHGVDMSVKISNDRVYICADNKAAPVCSFNGNAISGLSYCAPQGFTKGSIVFLLQQDINAPKTSMIVPFKKRNQEEFHQLLLNISQDIGIRINYTN